MFEAPGSVTARQPFCDQCNVLTNLNGRALCCEMAPTPTTLQDVWTEDKCIQLIREFRARPVLWDPKHPFFYKKTMKPEAWREVGEIMNIEPDACKQKMIVLMSSFRREKAKIMHSITDNPDDVGPYTYKSTWFAFKEMAFLMDKEMERKRQLTGEDTEDEDVPSIKKVILQHVIQTPIIKGMPQARSPLILRKDRGRSATEVREDSLSPTPSSHTPSVSSQILTVSKPPSGPSQTQSERDEEIQSFFKFIGNKMRRYSDVTKNAVQQAICEIIFKADQNQYESNCYEKYTIIDSEGDPLDKISFDPQNGTVIKEQVFTDSE